MNILRSAIIVCLACISISSCQNDPDIFPSYPFTEDFSDGSDWQLVAESIPRDPIFGPPIPQTAKIESGKLVLASNQEGGCAEARASHYFDVQQALGTTGKFDIKLFFSSYFRSSFGDITCRIQYQGNAYELLIFENSSSPKLITLSFDGDSLKGNTNATISQNSYPNPSVADGFTISVLGCGPDNFHSASISLDAMMLVTYVEQD